MQTYWNPWSIFDELERSFFDAASSSEWPQFDIVDGNDETVLTADVPGMSDDDLEITAQAPYLVVRGERKAKEGRYLRRARHHGAFERRFWIGEGYDLEHVDAHIANGELVIRLEKAAKAKPRRIKLTTGIAAKVKGLLASDKDKERRRRRRRRRRPRRSGRRIPRTAAAAPATARSKACYFAARDTLAVLRDRRRWRGFSTTRATMTTTMMMTNEMVHDEHFRPVAYVTMLDRGACAEIVDVLERAGWCVILQPTGFHLIQAISGVIDGEQTWLRPSLIVIDARSRGCAGTTIAAGLRDLGITIPIVLVAAPGDALAVSQDATLRIADRASAASIVAELARARTNVAAFAAA